MRFSGSPGLPFTRIERRVGDLLVSTAMDHLLRCKSKEMASVRDAHFRAAAKVDPAARDRSTSSSSSICDVVAFDAAFDSTEA
ncbi:hypothetical protein MTO96_038456 [Rhipicephalus appendiculatus]